MKKKKLKRKMAKLKSSIAKFEKTIRGTELKFHQKKVEDALLTVLNSARTLPTEAPQGIEP